MQSAERAGCRQWLHHSTPRQKGQALTHFRSQLNTLDSTLITQDSTLRPAQPRPGRLLSLT
jgi:hypothetical protein